MSEESNRNIIGVYVVFGIAVIMLGSICIICCCFGLFNIKWSCEYVWLPPVLKFASYALTSIAITIISKYILDYEAKINHDALSFEKAKMVSEKISTSENKKNEKTINLNIKKE